MRRGDIWTISGGAGYAGKPRPAVVVQDDIFDATSSITVCAFTTDATEAPLLRLAIEPNAHNGLRAACRLMVDKVVTVPKSKLGARLGRLDHADIVRLDRALLVFLGLAASSARRRRSVVAQGELAIAGTRKKGDMNEFRGRRISIMSPFFV